MSDIDKRNIAGTVVKIILLALALTIVAAVVYGIAVFSGKAPLPQKALNVFAARMDMPQYEREMMSKALEVYEVLRSSEAGGDIKELRKLATHGASKEEVAEQLTQSYSLLSGEDLEEIRRILEVEPDDFAEGKSIIDRGMESYSLTGEFSLSEGDRKKLEALGKKYGLSEESLEEWSDS